MEEDLWPFHSTFLPFHSTSCRVLLRPSAPCRGLWLATWRVVKGRIKKTINWTAVNLGLGGGVWLESYVGCCWVMVGYKMFTKWNSSFKIWSDFIWLFFYILQNGHVLSDLINLKKLIIFYLIHFLILYKMINFYPIYIFTSAQMINIYPIIFLSSNKLINVYPIIIWYPLIAHA